MPLNYKRIFVSLFVFLTLLFLYDRKTTLGSTKFIDPLYTVKTSNNIKYGTAVGYNGKPEDLFLDIYEPNDESSENRPLIVFVHGGSFVAGDKSVYSENAVNMAKKGYVVSSINYRLDTTRANNPYNARSPDLDKPIGTSREDTLMAIRFLIGKSQDYRINTEKIFLGGSSAGAVTALYTAFSEEVDAKKIKAVYAIAGTVVEDDLDIIDENDPPTIMFNGTTDTIVPYSMATATIDKLKSKGVTANLVTYQGAGHGIISQKNADIHQKLTEFLYPYVNLPSLSPTPTQTVNMTPTPTGLINQTITPTISPTPVPLTVEDLIKNYLNGDKKYDLNNDGIINGFDYFKLYEKIGN